MGKIKDLKTEEQIELLHARLCTIEAVLCELFVGFHDDIENYAVNELEDTTLTRAQKDKIQATLLDVRSKYKAKGEKQKVQKNDR
jgi:hypothetical protein